MNSTEVIINNIKDYYTVCLLSGAFALVAVAISIIILILVCQTKPRLHTVRHLLICNTCVASILYCIAQANSYIFLIFLPDETSDISCRWRGYFAYATICGVAYSFLIQSISRLFICVFSTKYKRFITFKAHHILICIQWLFTIVVPLPAIITQDIYFRPNTLCWVPLKRKLHVAYTYVMYYTIPAVSIWMIYIYIYHYVKQIVNRAVIRVRSINNDKRDLKLLRNILILSFIYLAGGIPTLLFIISSNQIFYLIGIVTISLAVSVEKLCTILLDRELRQVIRKLLSRTGRITPLNNPHMTAIYQPNVTQIQRGVGNLYRIHNIYH